jgi:hypothetical protein
MACKYNIAKLFVSELLILIKEPARIIDKFIIVIGHPEKNVAMKSNLNFQIKIFFFNFN